MFSAFRIGQVIGMYFRRARTSQFLTRDLVTL